MTEIETEEISLEEIYQLDFNKDFIAYKLSFNKYNDFDQVW